MELPDSVIWDLIHKLGPITPESKEINKIRLLVARIKVAADAETPLGNIEAETLARLTIENVRRLPPAIRNRACKKAPTSSEEPKE